MTFNKKKKRYQVTGALSLSQEGGAGEARQEGGTGEAGDNACDREHILF